MVKRKRKNKGIRLIHLVLIFLLVYVAVVFTHQNKLNKDLNAKKSKNLAEIEALENEIADLNEEINLSGTLQFVEKVAREELGMVKPREIVYIDKNKPEKPLFDIFKKDN